MCCADAQSGKVLGDQFIGEGAGRQGEEGAGAGSSTPGSGRDQQEAAGMSAFSNPVTPHNPQSARRPLYVPPLCTNTPIKKLSLPPNVPALLSPPPPPPFSSLQPVLPAMIKLRLCAHDSMVSCYVM